MSTIAFFDNITYEKCFKQNFGKNQGCDEIIFKSLNDCSVLCDENFNKHFLFLAPNLLLPDKSVVDFVEFLKDHDLMRLKFKVFVVEDINDDAEILIKWFCYLNKNFGFDFEIISEVSFDEFAEKSQNIIEKMLLNFNDKLNSSNGEVVIYTDGACSGNPGAGGWGAILMHENRKKEISGFEQYTTNNIMELTAVIESLKILKKPCKVELFSDSAYVVNAINQGWLENWKNNNWLGSDKKPVKNEELWKSLCELLDMHQVNFNKVKGHADNQFNNRCDELATGEIAKHANENM